MTDIAISVYHNEDLARDFTLRKRKAEFTSVKRPTEDQLEPQDIAGAVFQAQAKFGARTLNIDVEVSDLADARLKFFVDSLDLRPFKNKTGVYDLIMTQNGITDRLWGGPFTVLEGATQ